MIDTDIYKAHTPAPWTVVCSIFAGRYYLTQAQERDAGNDEDCANADLMQDAPLLLAEVIRLRELLSETEYRLEMAEDVLGRSDWNTIYREIIDEDGEEE
jgi:hypothetical protein